MAWRTLIITTICLTLSFATWFVISGVVVMLPKLGYKFDTMQLFWLAAMPGLAGGSFRAINSFLIPIFGTRNVVSVTTWIKIIPMVWLAIAIMNPATPFWVFLVIALLCGLGGGDFSSYMPSTSIFFPKRLQGVALGLQAGIGNFGVSLTQFVTPAIIGVAVFGFMGSSFNTTQTLTVKAAPVKAVTVTKEAGAVKDVVVNDPAISKFITVTKDSSGAVTGVTLAPDAPKDLKVDVKREGAAIKDVTVKKVVQKTVWAQNAAIWYVPFLVIMGIIAFVAMKSIPVKASFSEQLDIFGEKHTWLCTIIYVMTFGSFAGLAATFPIMIGKIYGVFPGAPSPLKYAFLGPLVGSAVRALFGAPSDKWGGPIFTMLSGIGLIIGCLILLFGGLLTPTSLDQFPMFLYTMLFLFLMSGIGNSSTFRQFPIVFAYSPRKAAGVIGWTSACAAYGPFIFAVLIGYSMTHTGNAKAFFWGALIFYIIATVINWIYYARRGAERGDWGTSRGTWWDTAKDTWTGK